MPVGRATAPYRGRSIPVLSPKEPHRLVSIQRDRNRIVVFADVEGMRYLARLFWLAASERNSVVFLPARGKPPARWAHLNAMPSDLVFCHRTLQLRPGSWKAMRQYLRPVLASEVTFPEIDREDAYPPYGEDRTDVFTHGRTGFVAADRETFEFLATSCMDLAETGTEDNVVACGRHDDEAFEIIQVRHKPSRTIDVLADTVPFRGTSIPVFRPSEAKGRIFPTTQNDGSLRIDADDEGLTRLADIFLLAASQREALVCLPKSGESLWWLPSPPFESCDLVLGQPSRHFRTSHWKEARAYLSGKAVRILNLPMPKRVEERDPAVADISSHARTGFIIAPSSVFLMLAFECLEIRGKLNNGFYCEGMGRHDPTALHILRMRN